MSQLINKKILIIAVSSAVLAITGCSAKRPNGSRVVVSPNGMNGGMNGMMGGGPGGGYYDGGALVNNDPRVKESGNALESIVYFRFDSSEILPEATSVLNQHASLLSNFQDARVLVIGHTDASGSREYNMALGERRAASVRNYLASKGIDPAKVEITSRGEEEASGNDDRDRRAVLSY